METATLCKYVFCIGIVKDEKKTTRFGSHLPGDYSLVAGRGCPSTWVSTHQGRCSAGDGGEVGSRILVRIVWKLKRLFQE